MTDKTPESAFRWCRFCTKFRPRATFEGDRCVHCANRFKHRKEKATNGDKTLPKLQRG